MLSGSLGRLIYNSKTSHVKRLSIRNWLVVACAFCLCGSGVAEEPARRFLDELRNQQYFDMAVEYLDRLAKSPNLPDDMRDSLEYEAGITLVQQSIDRPQEPKTQEAVLLAAREKLNAFLSQNPRHPLANVARTKLGKVQEQRAANRRRQAEPTSVPDDKKKKFREQAIELYDDARKIYEDGRSAIRKQLEAMPKAYDPEVEPEKAKHLAQLRNEYVAVRFNAAVVQFEKAMVTTADSKLRNELLADAEKRFDSISNDYRRRSQGLLIMQAGLFLGRCNQEMGKLKEAISFYVDILDQREETLQHPIVRTIASECLMRAIDCWNMDEQQKFDAAIEKGEWWLKGQRPDERNSRNWLGLKLSLANAYLGKSKKVSGNAKQKAVASARRLLNEVSKVASPFQRRAQEQFVSLTKGNRTEDAKREPPKSFADAVQQAKEIRSEHQVATATVKLLSKRMKTVADEVSRQRMQTKVDEADLQLVTLRATEVDLLTTAIQMADEDATPEQIQDLQYWLAIYYYLQEDDYRASVLGEFIARRYTDTRYGQHAARIALTALNRIRESDAEFAADASTRLASVATFLLERWPNTEASNAAIEIIIHNSVHSKEFDIAEKFLAKLPENSKRRGSSELLIGQSLWTEFSRERKLLAGEKLSEEILAVKNVP